MNSKDLEYVLTISRTKSFSKAAELLFISQPALSQYITRLEQHLGVQLFFRSRLQIALTPAGTVFVNQASSILNQMQALEHSIRSFNQQRKYELSFGVSQFYGKHVLSPIISGLHEKMPKYKVNIIDGESRFLEEQILLQKLDFGIFPEPIYNKSINFMPIYQEQILFAFNQKNTAAKKMLKTAYNGKSVDLAYYKDFPFILLKEGLKMQKLSLRICSAYGFKPQAVYQSENLDTVYSLVESNYGVAFLPSTILRSIDQEKNHVLFYPIKSKYSTRTIGLAYLKDLYEEKFIQKLISAASFSIQDEV
jgi:LysR family hydrogen peroxide-inducible transcriptional activator